MSILNVHVTTDRAVVAVDTKVAKLVQGQDPVYGTIQKAMIHGDVVVASRGGLGLPGMLHTLLIAECRFWRTDELMTALRAMLPHAQDMHRAALAEAKGTPGAQALEHEIVAVGWSERLARTDGVVATQRAHGWQIEPIPTRMVAPGLPNVTGDDLSTQAAMKATAARQIEEFKKVDPTAPIGGELLQYEILRDGIIVRKLGSI